MDKNLATVDGQKTFDQSHKSCRSHSQKPFVWSSPEGGQKIDIGKQIFCNRSLNMRNIVAVGFDMDYTLAQYKPETFESLAYAGTIKKLVNDLGYPHEVGLMSHVHLSLNSFIKKCRIHFFILKLLLYLFIGFIRLPSLKVQRIHTVDW